MALDPITGLPSSNVQTVYAGDKPISVPATPTMPAVAPTTPVVTPNAPFSTLTQTTPLQGSLTPKTPIVPPTGTYEQMAQSAYSQPQVETPEAALNKQLVGQYQQMLGLGTGQGVAEQKAAEQGVLAKQYGTVETQNRINEIAKQVQANQLTTQGQQLSIQGKGFGAENVETGAARFERENAVKNLSLASESLALQGKLDSANAAIKQAIDIKYGPQEAKLAAIKEFMAVNQAELSRQDAKAMEKQKTLLAAKEKDLAETKKNETDIASLVTNAASQGAPQDIRDRAAKAKTPMEAANILGVYSGDYLSNQIKTAQLAKLGLENKKALQELQGDPSGLKYLSYEENAKFNSTPEAKAVKDATAYAKAVSDYKSAIEKYGTGELFGKGSGELGQAYSALVGATKDYYTLGTLDNGVQKLIALGIPEPGLTGLKAGRIDALDTALTAAGDTIKRNTDQLLSTKYAKTNELKQLVDNAGSVLMYRMTNQDLLNSIPGSSGISTSNTTTTNSNYFNK